MLPEIKKILYTTDLSPNSAFALRYAMGAAIQYNAKIVILHVVEFLSKFYPSLVDVKFEYELRSKISKKRVAETINIIRRRLEIFCDKEFDGKFQYIDRVDSIEVCEGFPAVVILDKANDLNCDAIVMGTHGKGIISHTFLGGTAKRVLRRTTKPVYIIPLPKGETELTFHDI